MHKDNTRPPNIWTDYIFLIANEIQESGAYIVLLCLSLILTNISTWIRDIQLQWQCSFDGPSVAKDINPSVYPVS